MWTLSPPDEQLAPASAGAGGREARLPEGGTGVRARSRREFALVVVVGVAFAAVLTARWSHGWLLLLDWAPGPRSPAWSGPELPVGVLVRVLVGGLAALDTQLVGWVPSAAAVVAAYAGGVHLARVRPGDGGRRISWLAACVGGCVAAANPFVASRLYAGQIGMLWGYAALLALTAAVIVAIDRDGPKAWLVPGAWWAVGAACTVHLALIGAVPVLLGVVAVHRRCGWRRAFGRAAATLAFASAITIVWLLPDLWWRGAQLGTAGRPAAIPTFASGGPVWNLWLRALGGAAFWRPLPEGALTFLGLVIVAAWLATIAVRRHGQGHSRDARQLLWGLAIVGVAAVYVSHGPLSGAWSHLAAGFWPAGLLREPGKLVMLALPAPIAGAAAATQAVRDGKASVRRVPAIVVAVALVTVGGIWSFTAALTPSPYPHDWELVREAIAGDHCAMAVLGDGAYTHTGFTGGRIVANPAQAYFGSRAVVSDDAGIPGLEPRPPVGAAARWSADVNARYIGEGGELPVATDAQEAGVGWVMVDRPGLRSRVGDELIAHGFTPVVATDAVGLWRTTGGCS